MDSSHVYFEEAEGIRERVYINYEPEEEENKLYKDLVLRRGLLPEDSHFLTGLCMQYARGDLFEFL